jgi:hypothetical protein
MVGFLAIVSGLTEHSSARPAAAIPPPKVRPTNVTSRNVQGELIKAPAPRHRLSISTEI